MDLPITNMLSPQFWCWDWPWYPSWLQLNLHLSFLKVENFDRDSEHGKEKDRKADKHCYWNSKHPRAIAKSNFYVLFHRALKTMSYDQCFHIPELRGNDSPEGPWYRTNVVKPDPPHWDTLYKDKSNGRRRKS